MRIRVTNYGSSTNVSVVRPDDAVSSQLGLQAGDSVELVCIPATKPDDIEVGEVQHQGTSTTSEGGCNEE